MENVELARATSDENRATPPGPDCWRLVRDTRLAAGLAMPEQLPWLASLLTPAIPQEGRFERLGHATSHAIVAIADEAGWVTHLGVVTGEGEFLHDTPEGPRSERLDAWQPRIEGFYEYRIGGDLIDLIDPSDATKSPSSIRSIRSAGSIGSPSAISLLLCRNPLTGEAQVADLAPTGRSIAELLAPHALPESVIVLLNGEPLMPDDWLYRPGAGDRLAVLAVPGSSSQMLGMFAMFALMIFAPYLIGALGPAFATTTAGVTTLTFAGKVAMFALVAGGGLLLNKLLAPSVKGSTSEPVYAWGQQTVQQQGIPVPRIYGAPRGHGNIIGHWSEIGTTIGSLLPDWYVDFMAIFFPTYSAPQMLKKTTHVRNVLVCFGEGPVESIDETSILINGRPLSDLPGVAVETRLGTLDQTAMTKFSDKTRVEFYAGATINDDYLVATYTLPGTGYDDAELTLLFDKGLYHFDSKHGDIDGETIALRIDAGDALADTWQTIYEGHITGAATTPVRWWAAASGTYTGGTPFTVTRTMQPRFRVTRLAVSGTSSRHIHDAKIAEVRGIFNEVFNHPGKVLMQISALPSAELSGSLDVSVVIEGSIVQTYAAGAWGLEWHRNPAWVAMDMLTQPIISGNGGATAYAVEKYRGVDPAQLLTAGFLTTEANADGQVPNGLGGVENRIEIDASFAQQTNVYDAVRQVGVTGRFGLDLRGNKIGLWCDNARTPVGLFGDGNWLKDSWEPDPIPAADRAGELEISYRDETTPDEPSRILVPDVLIATTNRSTIDLPCTRRKSEAWRTGKYNLGRNRLIDLSGGFQCDIDGLIYEPGDVLYIQLDGRSVGGRLASVDLTADTVTLDRDVTTSASDILIVQFRDPATGGQTTGTRAVAAVTGRIVSFSGSWVFPAGVTAEPAADDCYLFGIAAIVSDTFEVIHIDPQPRLQFSISVVRCPAALATIDNAEPEVPIDYGAIAPPAAGGGTRPPTPSEIEDRLPDDALSPAESRGITVAGLDVTGNGVDTITWYDAAGGDDFPDGYAGSIRYNGWIYTIQEGSTTDKYVWFDLAVADPTALQTGAAWPSTLHFKMFVNIAGDAVALYGQEQYYDETEALPLLVDGSRTADKLGIEGNAYFTAEYDNGDSGDSAVAASQTLTLDTTPTDGETITLGSTTYRFKATPAQAEDIQLGSGGTALADSQANLAAAINGTGTEGVEYYAGTTAPHASVEIGAFAANAATVTALAAGTAGNSIATTETFTAETNVFGGVTLSGGSQTVTIDWRNGNKQKLTITADCTLAFTAPDGAANLLLRVIQDGTGGWALTLPANVYPAGKTALAFTTDAGAVDLLMLYYDADATTPIYWAGLSGNHGVSA